MLLKLESQYKSVEVDYEKEVDIDMFYEWGITESGKRSIIRAMTEAEAISLCEKYTQALQDRGITRKEAQGGKE